MLSDLRKTATALLSFFTILIFLTSCSEDELNERLWLKAPGWSRAQLVTFTASIDRADITLDDEGSIYIAHTVAALGEEDQHPGVIAIEQDGQVKWRTAIQTPLGRNHDPQLLWDGRYIHVFWILENKLYSTRLERSGAQLNDPVLLSGDVHVDEFALARKPTGQITIWYAGSRQEPGLYALEFREDKSKSQLVDAEGIRPAIKYDTEGDLHVAWTKYLPGSSEFQLFYANYPEGIYQPEQGINIISPSVATTSVVLGPYLGVESGNSYIFWSIAIRSGPQAGQATTSYIHFPSDQPEAASSPLQINIPAEHELEYIDIPGADFSAGSRVDVATGNIPLTSGLRGIHINPTPANELAITFQGTVDYLFRRQVSQIGLNFFENGRPNGYQLLSFTSTASRDPTVISDDSGYLYLTWLEPAEGQFKVFLASTAPDLQKAYRSPTSNDIQRLAVDTLYGLTTGAVLTPIAFVLWAILPVLAVIITSPLRRGDNSFSNPLTLLSLGVAVVVSLAVKYFSLPGIVDYVPFSAWLPLPSGMQALLQYLVPLSITIIAILIAWSVTYRRRNESPFYFIIVYVAVDSLMTMAVYGGLIYGAF